MILRSGHMSLCCHRQFRKIASMVNSSSIVCSGAVTHSEIKKCNLASNRTVCTRHSSLSNLNLRHLLSTPNQSSMSPQLRGYACEEGLPLLCSHLKGRTLLRAAGRDATDFLQGLITNDMRSIEHQEFSEIPARSSMYAMLLNIQGRVLYDLLIYRMNNDEETPVYFLECETEVVSDLLKLMKRYKLRKKVDLSIIGDEYKVWAVTPGGETAHSPQMVHLSQSAVDTEQETELNTSGPGQHIKLEVSSNTGALLVRDPRVDIFGHRLILREDVKGSDILAGTMIMAGDREYHQRRYIWGVSEGLLDLPPGESLPLESNLVFMNGVSFSKGCYIGQELTARTHHTGVVRKRLLPVTISGANIEITPGAKVENYLGKNCGKFRNAVDSHGMALLRIADVVGKGPLVVKNQSDDSISEMLPSIPSWWPRESDQIIKQALTDVEKQ